MLYSQEAEDGACDVEGIIYPKVGIECNIDDVTIVHQSVANMMKYVTTEAAWEMNL